MAGLVLGGVSFGGFEIPNQINFGGEHNITVHELAGGSRVLDAMGSKPDPISWSGRFRGPNAVARAQAIDELRIAGSQIDLAWLNFARSVVVRSFKANTEKAYEIPYQITCEVVSEAAASLGNNFQSIDSLVNADQASANGFATSSVVQSALSTLSASLATVGPIAGSTALSRTAASKAIDTATVALQAAAAAENKILGQVMPLDTAFNLVAWLNTQTNAAVNHSATNDVMAYVRRMGANILAVKA